MSRRRVAVVMAGGSGERFWPLSRRVHPKQLLKLTHPQKSMLAEAVDRVEPLVRKDNVYIATAAHLVESIREGMPQLSHERIHAEPYKRNTAGCLVWIAAQLLAENPQAAENTTMAVLTADHRIAPEDGFRQTVKTAMDTAEETGSLVTIGIRPDRPETGYGYIEVAETGATESGKIVVHPVRAFKEKPNRETAEKFVASGRYLWNSGTFFWCLDRFLSELEQAAPDLRQAVDAIAAHLRRGDIDSANQSFAEIRSISIDYALMERAKNVRVVEAAFDWDDVGSWDALDRTLPHDADGNVVSGSTLVIDTRRSIVLNENPALKICLVGVEDLTVVVTEDAIMICPKSRAQDVRQIVEKLRETGDEGRL